MQPKPFTFDLEPDEINQIITSPQGSVGHQAFRELIIARLGSGSRIEFNDEELGRLIRYIGRYGSGGFQGRLRKAFLRSIKEALEF